MLYLTQQILFYISGTSWEYSLFHRCFSLRTVLLDDAAAILKICWTMAWHNWHGPSPLHPLFVIYRLRFVKTVARSLENLSVTEIKNIAHRKSAVTKENYNDIFYNILLINKYEWQANFGRDFRPAFSSISLHLLLLHCCA
jgi:hypothetical protein